MLSLLFFCLHIKIPKIANNPKTAKAATIPTIKPVCFLVEPRVGSLLGTVGVKSGK